MALDIAAHNLCGSLLVGNSRVPYSIGVSVGLRFEMDKVSCALSSLLLDVYKTFRCSNSGKEKRT